MRHPSGGVRPALLLTLIALLVALGAGVAAPADAAPTEPIMSLARLQTLLEESPTGTVDGFFKTVLKGSTIVSIPCTIEGVVPQAATDNGDLILFEAHGALIDEAGGFAAGMSGSPLYVDDAGAKLVGATSYGGYFAGNLGLATPIEHMVAIEDDFTIDPLAARVAKAVTLPEPVSVGGRRLAKVVTAPTSLAARAYGRPGSRTAVLRALSVVQVGGIDPMNQAFRHLKSRLAAQGIEVRAGLQAGAAGSLPTFTAPLEPGAAVGDLLMQGDTWVGSVGTVTYITDDAGLVAFGHPMMWDGVVSTYLTNAAVIGMWRSTDEPFKLTAPGAVRGTVTVDTGAGIAGRIGALPDDVPFTCSATATATGKTVTTHSYMTPWAADQSKYPYGTAKAMAFLPALYLATGDSAFDGHVTYTMTIGLSDGVDSYTVTRRNTWEDTYGYDAPYLCVVELASMMDSLTADPDGTIRPHLTGIDMQVDIAPTLHRARVADVEALGALRVGENTVRVTLYRYGSLDPLVMDVPLTIPEGMSTKGVLYAKAPYANVESLGDGWYGYWSYEASGTGPPQTLADHVERLAAARDNSTLLVAYDPSRIGADNWWDEGEPWSGKALVRELDTDLYLTGEVQKAAATIRLRARPAVSGRPVLVSGSIDTYGDPLEDQVVQIYARESGESADTLVAELPVRPGDDEDENRFSGSIPARRYNTVLTAVWRGDGSYLASSVSRRLPVAARVSCTARARGGAVVLRAGVTPRQSRGKVSLQRKKGRRWVEIRRVRLVAGRATATWAAPAGRHTVRAVFRGSARNASGASRAIRVIVR